MSVSTIASRTRIRSSGLLAGRTKTRTITPPLPGALDASGFNGAAGTEPRPERDVVLDSCLDPDVPDGNSPCVSAAWLLARTQANADQDLFKEFGIGGLNPTTSYCHNGGLPLISPEGYSDVRRRRIGCPTKEYNNVWDFIQNVSINKGKHALSSGTSIGRSNSRSSRCLGSRPFSFPRNRTAIPEQPGQTGDGYASFLLGYPGNSRLTTTNFISSEKVAHAWYYPGRLEGDQQADPQHRPALRTVLADQREVRPTVELRSGDGDACHSQGNEPGRTACRRTSPRHFPQIKWTAATQTNI